MRARLLGVLVGQGIGLLLGLIAIRFFILPALNSPTPKPASPSPACAALVVPLHP